MTKISAIFIISLIFCIDVQTQTYFGQQLIISGGVDGTWSAYAGDLDGDGDMDVITGFYWDENIITWYENIDGNGNFGSPHVVDSSAGRVVSLFTIDIDSDGDLDVLSCVGCYGKIIWYENVDGNGNLWIKQIISANLDQASSVYAADIDGDNDIDVLSTSTYDDKVAWYENTDGNGDFGEQIIISTSADGPVHVIAIDMDDDGDMDVLISASWGDKIAWFENTNGGGNFGTLQVISDSVDGPRSVFATDLDGDGDTDVLSASYNDHKIAWYENLDGEGQFGEQQIISTSVTSAMAVFSADFDNDGDMDVLAAAGNGDSIVWFENEDGEGNFGEQQIITTLTDFPTDVFAFDLNGDGDLDVLSVSNNDGKIAWYKNLTLKILDHPFSQEICPNSGAVFTVISKNATNYQWQLDEGNGFFDLIDNSLYSGVLTNTLSIISAGITMTGFQYRCVLSNPGGSQVTNEATLSIADYEAPVITSCHPDIILYADNSCEAVLQDFTGDVTAIDNCDNNLTVFQTPEAGSLISGDSNIVSLTVMDDANNSSDVSFKVNVLDNTPPAIVCPDNQTIELSEEQTFYIVKDNEFNPVSVYDNCSIENISNNINGLESLAGTKFSVGTTTISWIAIDKANNDIECSFDVTIEPYEGIFIYPNPAKRILYIEFFRDDIQRMKIFDINGKLIFEKKVTKQNENIDLLGLSTGVYFIQILTNDEVFITKIIKKR
jgi:hypothetical protein